MKKAIIMFMSLLAVNSVTIAAFYNWEDGQPHTIDDSTYQDHHVWLDYGVNRAQGTHVDVVEGAVIFNINAYHNATVAMSGGTVLILDAFNNAEVDVTGGTSEMLMANVNSSIRMSGGSVESIYAVDDGTVNLSGGVIQNCLYTLNNGFIYLHGSEFQVNGKNLSYGDKLSDFSTFSYDYHSDGFAFNGIVTGTLADGSVLDAFFNINEHHTGDIIIVPEPATLSLLVLGSLALFRKRK